MKTGQDLDSHSVIIMAGDNSNKSVLEAMYFALVATFVVMQQTSENGITVVHNSLISLTKV